MCMGGKTIFTLPFHNTRQITRRKNRNIPPLCFPGGLVVKNLLQNRTDGFDPWVVKIPWKRSWQPTPVFFPGESHRQRSLGGYSPWGRKESDTTELHTDTHTNDSWVVHVEYLKVLFLHSFFFIWLKLVVYRILAPRPGTKSEPWQ